MPNKRVEVGVKVNARGIFGGNGQRVPSFADLEPCLCADASGISRVLDKALALESSRLHLSFAEPLPGRAQSRSMSAACKGASHHRRA